MSSAKDPAVGRSEVEARLDRVTDPELDRSIVELQYVTEIRVDGSRVTVEFVLPTAWCSPAFAWMMATGIRDEVGALPGVNDVRVELLDHMHGDQLNRGVNDGLAFQEVFEDAEDGVEAVRETLDRKARLARQHRAVEELLDAGLDPAQVVGLTRDDVERIDDRLVVYLREGTVGVTVAAEPIDAYLEKAREVAVATGPEDRLFVDPDGGPIAPADFETVHRETRLARSNMSGQAALCAQLHEARNGVTLNGE